MHSGILGLVCFPPHSVAPVHIICHNLPSPHFINLLQFNLIVIISLDFSKAFDTIRHSMLLSKRAELDLPTPSWWTFSAATHTIPCSMEASRAREASRPACIQGSAQSYWTSLLHCHSSAHLRPLNPDNIFIKFADDTYLVFSHAANSNSTRAAEIDNIAAGQIQI